jgi:malate dehydrogenase
MFGPDTRVVLKLLDIPQGEKMMKAAQMELDDGAYPLLESHESTCDPLVSFKDCDYALLVGAFPRLKGMERKDLLAKNISIFKEQGGAIDKVASKNCRVLTVGNPANTNGLMCKHYAPHLPKENFSCLTRLDHNRALSQVAQKVGVPVREVHNVCIWGNHSNTQFPDLSHATLSDGRKVADLVDEDYNRKTFIPTVQTRGAKVIEARGLSSACSAANAIADHVRDWVLGTKEVVSMGVISDGNPYGVADGLLYSFPVRCPGGGKWEIVSGLELNDFQKEMVKKTEDELVSEKAQALEILEGHQ